MAWFKLRPTFELEIPQDTTRVRTQLLSQCRQLKQPTLFLMHDEYGELHLPADQHRLWSPHLSFYVESRGEQTVVHGRFAPRLTVWTSVWIAYLFLAFTAFFAIMLGGVQLGIGLPPWGLAIGFLAALSILGLYTVAHIGQQWSVDQMHQLRDRLIDLLQHDSGLT